MRPVEAQTTGLVEKLASNGYFWWNFQIVVLRDFYYHHEKSFLLPNPCFKDSARQYRKWTILDITATIIKPLFGDWFLTFKLYIVWNYIVKTWSKICFLTFNKYNVFIQKIKKINTNHFIDVIDCFIYCLWNKFVYPLWSKYS